MRYSDWPERLDAFLSQPHDFDWATCNCALFAADAIKAMTGQDFAGPFRKEKTKAGMLRKLRTVANLPDASVTACLFAVATQCLGEPIDPLLAKRGDVLAADVGNGVALGICAGANGYFVGVAGYSKIPLAKCVHAWRVE